MIPLLYLHIGKKRIGENCDFRGVPQKCNYNRRK